MAGERHGMCESALTVIQVFPFPVAWGGAASRYLRDCHVVWSQCSYFLAANTVISFLPCLSSDVAAWCGFDDAQNHVACVIHTTCKSTQATNGLYIVSRPAFSICFAYFFNYRFLFLFKTTLFAKFEVCIAAWFSIPFFCGMTRSDDTQKNEIRCLFAYQALTCSLCMLGLSGMKNQTNVRRRMQWFIACVESEGVYFVACLVA
jgi:hypothetical protein